MERLISLIVPFLALVIAACSTAILAEREDQPKKYCYGDYGGTSPFYWVYAPACDEGHREITKTQFGAKSLPSTYCHDAKYRIWYVGTYSHRCQAGDQEVTKAQYDAKIAPPSGVTSATESRSEPAQSRSSTRRNDNVDHEQCLSYGLTFGTPAYSDCRLRLAKMKLEQETRQKQDRRERIDRAARILQNLGQQFGGGARIITPQPPVGGGIAQGTAFYKSSYISGFNKICMYDRMGSAVSITIGNTELCPLTLP